MYTQYRAISSGDTLRLWEECGQGNPSTSSFQPTDPSNLSISNYGGHPKLTWTGSEPGSSAKYIVYRNSSAITEPPLSSLSYVDQDITLGGGFNISYKVRAVSGDGSKYSTNYSNTVSTQGWYSKPADTTVAVTPGDRILTGNFPNPFNPETRITFALNDRSHVHLLAYDVLGREVSRLIDGDLDPGNHEAVWRGSGQNGRKLPSGMYICELQHRRGTERMKMMLVR